MANKAYNRGLFRMGNFQWDSDAISLGVILLKNTYVFNALHNVVSDLTPLANETTGAGYVRATIAAAARTVNEDDGGSAANFRITNGTVVWVGLSAGIDLRVALFFIGGGGIGDDANNDLLCYIDTGTNVPINSGGGDVTLNFSTDGCLKLANA